MTTTPTTTAAPSRRWLFGALPDWLLGCGGLYVLALALQGTLGADLPRYVPGGALVLAFSLPHYGATLLRAYERPEDRQRYWLFVVPVTAALVALFAAGLQWGLLGSLLLTLYLTWSPWHYTGQNYGVFLMLAGRRGVQVGATAKRCLWWSFFLSYVLTFLAIHSVGQGGTYAPVSYEGTAFAMMPIGLRGPWVAPLIAVVALGYVTSLVAAVALLARRSPAGLAALAPSLGVAVLQATWFSVPVIARFSGLASADSPLAMVYSAYGFLWIASIHAIQYLWITTYYAAGAAPASGRALFLAKAALAGFAVWTVPGLLFAPGLLGDLPYESGLAVLVASMVNLHHFILDGVVWKLREGSVARVLLGAEHEAPERSTGRRRWIGPAIWATGAACVGLSFVSFWESEFGFGRSLERGDLARAGSAVERIALLGRDGPARHTKLGLEYEERGRLGAARAAYTRSLALRPTALAWQSLGRIEEREEHWDRAVEAYASALEFAPDDVATLYRLGQSALEAGAPERARAALERAVELAPGNQLLRPALAKAKRAVRALESQRRGGDTASISTEP